MHVGGQSQHLRSSYELWWELSMSQAVGILRFSVHGLGAEAVSSLAGCLLDDNSNAAAAR